MTHPDAPVDPTTAAVLMALAGVRGGSSVLDVGAGSDLLARAAAAAAARDGRVVSCDDAGILDLERPRASAALAAPLVRAVSCVDRLPVSSSAFDTLICAGGWPLDLALPELARAARGGARLVAGVRSDAVAAVCADVVAAGFEMVRLADGEAAGLTYVVARRAA